MCERMKILLSILLQLVENVSIHFFKKKNKILYLFLIAFCFSAIFAGLEIDIKTHETKSK